MNYREMFETLAGMRGQLRAEREALEKESRRIDDAEAGEEETADQYAGIPRVIRGATRSAAQKKIRLKMDTLDEAIRGCACAMKSVAELWEP